MSAPVDRAPARDARQWGMLYAKGVAMGLADLVPGVSGGTIAFITGIYEELLGTIAGLRLRLLGVLRRSGAAAAWREGNFGFLAVLLGGILTSVLLFAGILHWLVVHRQVELWAFFFGLVAASVPLVGRSVARWEGRAWGFAALGTAAAFVVTSLPPLVQSDAPAFLAMCGAIAICAMILPGISGSFILLILGAYAPVLAAIRGIDVLRLLAFGGGVVFGLLSFSRALRWLLERYRRATLAVLTGFLVGSLNALWPWKEQVRPLYTHSDGRIEWLEANRWPTGSAEWLPGLGLALLGAVIVLGLDELTRRRARRRARPPSGAGETAPTV